MSINSWFNRYAITAAVLLLCFAFLPDDKTNARPEAPVGNCTPNWEFSTGYTFIRPDLIDIRTAYAPYLLEWGSFYRDSFSTIDWQKKENVEEWSGRFCDLPEFSDVEDVIYKVSDNDLSYLADLVDRKKGSTELGYPFGDNTFAQCIVYNGCSDVVDYIKYARSCEQFTVRKASKWRLQADNKAAMLQLIRVGKTRFNETSSHFLRLRYLYQIVRLAHYAGEWEYTIGLYNELMKKVEIQKPSIMFFWALGHVAGALQRLGRYGDAAYKYALIFQRCPSKRSQAFESFKIRNDKDWDTALLQCNNEEEKSVLYLLRAGKYRSTFMEDFKAAYDADAGNPQLTLLLISETQYLEKKLLRTTATDKRFDQEYLLRQQRNAANQLIDFQDFVRMVVKNGGTADPMVWRCIDGYLEVIAKDNYAAEQTFQSIEKDLPKDLFRNQYQRQIEIWRTLMELNMLDTSNRFDYNRAEKIRGYKAFKDHPDFEPYLQDKMAAWLDDKNYVGLSFIAVYGPRGLYYNPSIPVIDQLIAQAETGNEDFLETTAAWDTSQGRSAFLSRLIDLKAITLLNQGNPDAALLVHRSMRATDVATLKKYSPFRESINDRNPLSAIDSLQVNSVEFVRTLIDFETRARAFESLDPKEAAKYYFLLGLAWYNTSYFGYEWELRDRHRVGYNWNRLAQGPVFPMTGSPAGNYENINVDKAFSYFEKARAFSRSDPDLGAKATFWMAKCKQKMWFSDAKCTYFPGSKLIPRPPQPYFAYYQSLLNEYGNQPFTQKAIRECKWLSAYQSGN